MPVVAHASTPSDAPRSRRSSIVRWQMAWLCSWAWILVGTSAFAPPAPAPGDAQVRDFWAFQPIRRLPPPRLADASRVRTDIDRFILAELHARNLDLSPPATRRDLLRRTWFDLVGLPPPPEEIAGFESDGSPAAFETRVDRLLASPHYGERWGRWWLDVARYADTNGQDENKVLANAWRYRDWVIRAFNANLPFDRFIVQQVAGDLLSPTAGETEQEASDRLVATGFLVLGPKMLAEQDKPKLVMDIVDEQIDTVGKAFLGLTLGCARCHDHKFDPVPMVDYYALAGIFKSTRTMENLEFVSKFNERRVATSREVADHAAFHRGIAELTNRLAGVRRDADVELLATLKAEFPRHLAAAVESVGPGTDSTGSMTDGTLRSNVLHGLRGLVAPDPATNATSRDLRSLASRPERLSRLFESPARNSARSPSEVGLRLAPGPNGAAFRAVDDDFLALPHSDDLEPSHVTVEAWVRVSAFPRIRGESRRWLVSKNDHEWTEGHYALVLDGRQAGAYLNIGGGKENVHAVWSGATLLQSNRWHHLAFTYDGAGLRLFVDGRDVAVQMVGKPRRPGVGPLVLARRPDGYIDFQGDLDEARVWRRALGAAELRSHYERPEDPVEPGAVARWEFNDLGPEAREHVVQVRLREALLGPGGPLALPADPGPHYPAATRERIATLERELATRRASAPPAPAVALAVDEDKPVELPVHLRGNHLQPGPNPVPRGFLQVVSRVNPAPPIPAQRSGRLELARWLVDPRQPLVARVVVNRVWQAHFSEGLVRTPDNFGLRGEPPTHPDLLDWLADRFIQSGWDLQALHRLILLSAVYQQATASTPIEAGPRRDDARVVDPDNRLLHRYPRRRLDAEMIRDALLSVSGRLDPTVGGTLVDWKNNEYTPPDETSPTSVRRTIYLPVVRDRTYDALLLFDFANPSVSTAKRVPTVVSQQALFFLNSPLLRTSARALAALLPGSDGSSTTPVVRAAFHRILGRSPTDLELERAERFVREYEGGPGSPKSPTESEAELGALAALCQALMASNEFVYRP